MSLPALPSAQALDALLEGRENGGKARHGPAGAAGEVYDERAAAKAGDAAAEGCERGAYVVCEAHGLRDAGHKAVDDGLGGLRRNIVARAAGASGSEDERGAEVIGAADDFALYPVEVGGNCGDADNFPAVFFQQVPESKGDLFRAAVVYAVILNADDSSGVFQIKIPSYLCFSVLTACYF